MIHDAGTIGAFYLTCTAVPRRRQRQRDSFARDKQNGRIERLHAHPRVEPSGKRESQQLFGPGYAHARTKTVIEMQMMGQFRSKVYMNIGHLFPIGQKLLHKHARYRWLIKVIISYRPNRKLPGIWRHTRHMNTNPPRASKRRWVRNGIGQSLYASPRLRNFRRPFNLPWQKSSNSKSDNPCT